MCDKQTENYEVGSFTVYSGSNWDNGKENGNDYSTLGVILGEWRL